MALPVFTFKVDATNAQQMIGYRTKQLQFGDGYKQLSAAGVNSEVDTWDFVLPMRDETTVLAVSAFFKPLGQHKNFLWTPPLEVQQIYRLTKPIKYQSVGLDRLGRPRTTISISIERVYISIPLPLINFTIAPNSVIEGNSVPGGTMVFTATRDEPNTSIPFIINFSVGGTGVHNVDYSQSGASSFTTTAGSLTIPVGQMSASIAIAPIPNNIAQADRTIVLSPIAQLGVWSVGTNNWNGTIIDDEPPAVSIVGGTEASGFTLSLSSISTANTIVNMSRTFFREFTAQTPTLFTAIIPAGTLLVNVPFGSRDFNDPSGRVRIIIYSGSGYFVNPLADFADIYFP